MFAQQNTYINGIPFDTSTPESWTNDVFIMVMSTFTPNKLPRNLGELYHIALSKNLECHKALYNWYELTMYPRINIINALRDKLDIDNKLLQNEGEGGGGSVRLMTSYERTNTTQELLEETMYRMYIISGLVNKLPPWNSRSELISTLNTIHQEKLLKTYCDKSAVLPDCKPDCAGWCPSKHTCECGIHTGCWVWDDDGFNSCDMIKFNITHTKPFGLSKLLRN